MTTELQTRYPNLRQFRFMAAVNQGFLVSANVTSNNILRSLQGIPNIDHYIVPCSPSGNLPATHYGADGTVRRHEAYKLFEYYDGLARADIDSWILNSEGFRLWSKADGFLDPPDGPWTFDQFLSATPPVLQRIILEPDVAVANMIVWAPTFLKGFINGYLNSVTGLGADFLSLRVSDDGTPPASHNIDSTLILHDSVQTIIDTFPSNGQVKAVLTTSSGQEFWNNVDGEVPPIELMSVLLLLLLVGQQLID